MGLSHYGSESEVKGAEFTQKVVGTVIDGKRIPYFTKIATLFCDSRGRQYSPPEFYSRVAFCNFLPDVFRVRQRVDEKQLLNPDAQKFFFRVVDRRNMLTVSANRNQNTILQVFTTSLFATGFVDAQGLTAKNRRDFLENLGEVRRLG